jgi:hypothetical protein
MHATNYLFAVLITIFLASGIMAIISAYIYTYYSGQFMLAVTIAGASALAISIFLGLRETFKLKNSEELPLVRPLDG